MASAAGEKRSRSQLRRFLQWRAKTYIDSFGDEGEQFGDTSYAFSGITLTPGASMAGSFPDGSSQTITLTQHCARCGSAAFFWDRSNPTCEAFVPPSGYQQVPCWTRTGGGVFHASTFADDETGDAMPYGVSRRGALATQTLQVLPMLADCDFRVPQALVLLR